MYLFFIPAVNIDGVKKCLSGFQNATFKINHFGNHL